MNRFKVLTEDPRALSRQLRKSDELFLPQRRKVVLFSSIAAVAMQVVALYQSGVLERMPEPDLPLLDADKVDASNEAYQFLSVGDGFLGLISYGVTALLAASGPADRFRRTPWIPVALAGKALVDAIQAGRLTRDQWTKHEAFCSWCLLAAGATFAALPLTWAEARAAVRAMRQRD